MTTKNNILTTSQLSIGYATKKDVNTIASEINLSLEKGKLIALIGAVTLTMKEKKNKKFLTKNLYQQLSRNFLNAIYNIKKK